MSNIYHKICCFLIYCPLSNLLSLNKSTNIISMNILRIRFEIFVLASMAKTPIIKIFMELCPFSTLYLVIK